MTEARKAETRRGGAWGTAVILALIWLVSGGGCVTGAGPVDGPVAETQEAPVPVRIALAPFMDMARIYGESRGVRSPLTGKMFVTGERAPEVADLLTAETAAFLEGRRLEVMPPESVGNVLEMLAAGSEPISGSGERGLLMTTARRVEAGAMLAGCLYRVHGRRGGRFAVHRPASLAFGLYLIDSRSGRMLWSGEFDETQRSLAENLLAVGDFIRRRGEWVGAERMAVEGVRAVLTAFPVHPGTAGEADAP